MAEVFAQGKVNFDWDKNYLADTRSHTIASVELGAKGDLWRLEDFEVRAILAYDMPSQKNLVRATINMKSIHSNSLS